MEITHDSRNPSDIEKDNIDKINIIDNFFEEELFLNIQNHITTKLYFTPKYFENTTEKTKENYYGSRWDFMNDLQFLNIFTDQVRKKYKIKTNIISSSSGIDLRNLDKFAPHRDSIRAKLNILIMIKGPRAVSNGTVFYTGEDLDIHVGFKENRAIMFPSARYHSPHASEVPNLKRYTASLFIQDYEEE